MNKITRYFACDFETTVYAGQDHTEVWASACVELGGEDVQIFHSIEETFEFFKSLRCNLVLYYHNLKFDGAFWLDMLLNNDKYSQAIIDLGEGRYEWKDTSKMYNNEFKYSISAMGYWYTITMKIRDRIIEIRDSLKLLPFSLKAIGKSFGTKHKKLEMEYEGFRYSGCEINKEEREYIANDVLVLKEALEIMFEEGHNKLTIGACCLAEYINTVGGKDCFYDMFPSVYDYEIDAEDFGEPNAGLYIKHSYKGGWCYLVRGKENMIFKGGVTADVNSLYPSVMSSESGNYYPIGSPTFWKGDYIPEIALREDKYFFIRIKTRFKIKKNKLPFIQIKGSLLYRGTEMLETSDVWDRKKNKYCRYYKDKNGDIHDSRVTLTLTCTDYKLFREHYSVTDFEILDGCWFFAVKGIFDAYIEKYKKIKIESKGAKRTLAKLFLNNLYGKMATNTDSSFKLANLNEENIVEYREIEENKKKAGYIPVGSAITSYARNFTSRTAQKNYHGKNERGFIYADTDSIHCDLKPEELIDVPVHDTAFCHWKLESTWDEAIFVRQKTYIEHIIAEDLKPIDNPYYSIKCAGMPESCKLLFQASMQRGEAKEEYIKSNNIKLNEEKEKFVNIDRDITDFKTGLKVPGKLLPKRIRGGVLLVETDYELRA